MKFLGSLLIFTVLVTGATSLQADPAVVFNHADGTSCTFFVDDAVYVGPATLVANNGGEVNAQCNAVLIAGDPPEKVERISDLVFGTPVGSIVCDIVLTPSGNGNMHNCDWL